jgi:hypothetical protein
MDPQKQRYGSGDPYAEVSLRRTSHCSLIGTMRFLTLFIALCLPGCLVSHKTFNEPLETTDIEALQPGVTTQSQVASRFGAPNELVQLGYRSAYMYEYKVSKSTGLLLIVFSATNEDNRTDRLWVFFDEAGILTHVGATLAANRAVYQMPWTAGQQADQPEQP